MLESLSFHILSYFPQSHQFMCYFILLEAFKCLLSQETFADQLAEWVSIDSFLWSAFDFSFHNTQLPVTLFLKWNQTSFGKNESLGQNNSQFSFAFLLMYPHIFILTTSIPIANTIKEHCCQLINKWIYHCKFLLILNL